MDILNFEFVGVSDCRSLSNNQDITSSTWRKIQSISPECADYDWPERGFTAEISSMQYQATTMSDAPKPTEVQLSEWREKTSKMYGTVTVPNMYKQQFDVVEAREMISILVNSLKMDSTPGVPYMNSAADNGKLIQLFKEELVDLTLGRIEKLISADLHDETKYDPITLIDDGLCDPVRVFVKKEGHQQKKIVNKRFRIIACISVVDQLVERFTSWFVNRQEISDYASLPSQPGMGFTDEASSLLYADVMDHHRHVKPIAAVDVSAWDWSCPGWLLVQAAHLKMCRTPTASLWLHKLYYNRAIVSGWSVFSLSNGHMYKQLKFGIMKSGRYETSSDNSRMRAFTTVAVGSEYAKCMGDDSVEEYVEGAPELYKRIFGMTVKAYELITDRFEFCAHTYTIDGIKPTSWAKTFMNYVHNETEDVCQQVMFAVQLLDYFKHSPEYIDKILAILKCVGWSAQSILESAYAQQKQQ